MKITILMDNGTEQIFNDVTDYYFAVRQLNPLMSEDKKIAILPETRSYSHGPNIRELIKELSQSLIELQDFLRGQNGNSSK